MTHGPAVQAASRSLPRQPRNDRRDRAHAAAARAAVAIAVERLQGRGEQLLKAGVSERPRAIARLNELTHLVTRPARDVVRTESGHRDSVAGIGA